MRFDHVVMAVRDLEEATRRYQNLGFTVTRGGWHPGRGTHNALIRFGLDYLELVAVFDSTAQARSRRGTALVEFLRQRPGGLMGYAAATDSIRQDAERLTSAGCAVEGPFPMERHQPDGGAVSWQLCVPTGTAWRRPWPFLIQWDAPDAERSAAIGADGRHANGATSVARLVILVRELAAAVYFYKRLLRLRQLDQTETQDGAPCARFALGEVVIDILAPTGGLQQQVMEEWGEGLYEVFLKRGRRSDDCDSPSRTPTLDGLGEGLRGSGIPPGDAFGGRISFDGSTD